jgi:hypothetical protein
MCVIYDKTDHQKYSESDGRLHLAPLCVTPGKDDSLLLVGGFYGGTFGFCPTLMELLLPGFTFHRGAGASLRSHRTAVSYDFFTVTSEAVSVV